MINKNNHNSVHKDEVCCNRYRSIVELLPTGKANAIKTNELAYKLGISVRKLRSRIAEERKEGEVICSSKDGGYYLPANRKEIFEFYQWASKQAKSINVALQSAHRALEQTEGQQELDVSSGGEIGQK